MTTTKEQHIDQERKKRIAKDQLRVQKIYKGDEREFTKLYTECRFLINIYKLKYSGNKRISVDDAYNEAAYICYANIKSGKLGLLSCELKDYISTVMRFKLYDEAKKNDKEVDIDFVPELGVSDNYLELIKIRIIVNSFVTKLKPPCDKILEWFYLDGQKYNDILLKLPNYNSVDAIKVQSYKCKKNAEVALQKELQVNGITI